MKEDKINRILNCSYKEFIDIYKDQSSQNDYHLKRGDINISFTNWVNSTSGGGGGFSNSNGLINEERTIKFQAPINAPQSVLKIIGKNATTINEKQIISINHKQASIDIKTYYQPDIMGEYFSVETEWHLKTLNNSVETDSSNNSSNKCSLDLIIRVTFNMTFVGNLFEVFIIKAASESALQYVDIVEEYLLKVNQQKQQQQLKLQQQQQILQQQLILQQKQEEDLKKQQQQQQQQLKQIKKSNNNKKQVKQDKKQNINNNNNNNNVIKPYENWTVDCNIDQIKNDLNNHLDKLRLNSLNASQGLLKVEISISEMKSEQLLQLEQQKQNVNNSPSNSTSSSSSSLNSATSDSSTSFLSPYNLGLTASRVNQQQQLQLQQQRLRQQQQQQQQQQLQYQQQQQQQQYQHQQYQHQQQLQIEDNNGNNINVSDLLKQIELTNRSLKEQRLVSEERVEDEIKSISQYFDDMIKQQEESKPWFPSFINISLAIAVVAVILSIFSKFDKRSILNNNNNNHSLLQQQQQRNKLFY